MLSLMRLWFLLAFLSCSFRLTFFFLFVWWFSSILREMCNKKKEKSYHSLWSLKWKRIINGNIEREKNVDFRLQCLVGCRCRCLTRAIIFRLVCGKVLCRLIRNDWTRFGGKAKWSNQKQEELKRCCASPQQTFHFVKNSLTFMWKWNFSDASFHSTEVVYAQFLCLLFGCRAPITQWW